MSTPAASPKFKAGSPRGDVEAPTFIQSGSVPLVDGAREERTNVEVDVSFLLIFFIYPLKKARGKEGGFIIEQ